MRPSTFIGGNADRAAMRRRLPKYVSFIAVAALGVAACGSATTTPSSAGSVSGFNPSWLSANVNAGTPVPGGTLLMVGQGDVDHLDTASAYYSVTYVLERAFARQLYSYAASSNIDTANQVVPDMAASQPTITNNNLTYTIHLRPGVMWNTNPPRAVTSKDFVLGFKRVCNPVSPFGAVAYYTATIAGMKTFCDAFTALTATDAPSLKAFMDSHPISGIQTPDDSTLAFNLQQPASDFLNILALPSSSAAPAEYESYVPDSNDLHNNLLSDGPYTITKYAANTEIDLDKNTAWQQSSDPIRHQYVDHMVVKEGLTSTAVQQQLEAGTADMEWDTPVPTSDLSRLTNPRDNRLGIFPSPDNNPYLIFNLQSINNNSALKNVKVRQALEYAIDKVAMIKIYGGSSVGTPLDQVVSPGQVGYQQIDPYPTPNHQGDPAKCKSMLAAAGVTNLTFKDVYRSTGHHPDIFAEVQKDFGACGVTVQGVIATTGGDYYGHYLDNPTAASTGVWDISEPGWIPDWYGNNGRTVVEPLFDGRNYGPNSTDYPDYNSSTVNALIDKALQAPTVEQAGTYWHQADVQIMADAPFIPFKTESTPIYHSSRVHNAYFEPLAVQYDATQVWLSP